jgi:hypothetical protein
MEGKVATIGLHEDLQECAGHLLAELHLARWQWQHGELTTEQYTERIGVIRHRREALQAASAIHKAESEPAAAGLFERWNVEQCAAESLMPSLDSMLGAAAGRRADS